MGRAPLPAQQGSYSVTAGSTVDGWEGSRLCWRLQEEVKAMRMMRISAQVPVLFCAGCWAKPVAHIVSALESSVGLGLCP